MTLVGLDGEIHRRLRVDVHYKLDGEFEYNSTLTIVPSVLSIAHAPGFASCERSGRRVPQDCLCRCELTSTVVLRHFLVKSEVSGRLALPELSVRCSLTGRHILQDEAETSAITGQAVTRSLLKTSQISGRRAEPEHFGRCDFSGAEALKVELATSELSSRSYRVDEQMLSAFSGKSGHKSEFVSCYETRQPIAIEEAERCAVTGQKVRPGILEECTATGQRVLPSELERCTFTGKKVLKRLLVISSISQAKLVEEAAVHSASGAFCTPAEAKVCAWSGRRTHPSDVRVCELIGLPVHFEYTTDPTAPRLQPLMKLLDGVIRTTDEMRLWDMVAEKLSAALRGGRCQIDASTLAPDGQHLAASADVRTLFGWRLQRAGLVYALRDRSIVGRVALGKLEPGGWRDVKR
jgi:hypothetical protein